MEKLCPSCKTVKSFDEFYTRNASRDKKARICKACQRDLNKRNSAAEQKAVRRERHLKQRYGITSEQFEALKAVQGGKCAICEKELQAKQHTHLDHCHKTGKVRKILCNQCNRGLGYLQDNPAILQKALQYLQAA